MALKSDSKINTINLSSIEGQSTVLKTILSLYLQTTGCFKWFGSISKSYTVTLFLMSNISWLRKLCLVFIFNFLSTVQNIFVILNYIHWRQLGIKSTSATLGIWGWFFRAPNICTDLCTDFRGGAKKQPVPWPGGTG